MFTSVQARAASAYRRTNVESASPYQVVGLLFDGLMQSLHLAGHALRGGDMARKGQEIGKSVRLLEEGLKLGLDMQRGQPIAGNLRMLYDYCIQRLTHANLRNDAAAIDEVLRLIAPVAESWRHIQPMAGGAPAATNPYASTTYAEA